MIAYAPFSRIRVIFHSREKKKRVLFVRRKINFLIFLISRRDLRERLDETFLFTFDKITLSYR